MTGELLFQNNKKFEDIPPHPNHIKDPERYYRDGSLRLDRFGNFLCTAPNLFRFERYLKFTVLEWEGTWQVRDGWNDKACYICKDRETAEVLAEWIALHGEVKLVMMTGNDSGSVPDGTVLELRGGAAYAGKYDDLVVAFRDDGEEVHVKRGQYKIFLAFDEPFPFSIEK